MAESLWCKTCDLTYTWPNGLTIGAYDGYNVLFNAVDLRAMESIGGPSIWGCGRCGKELEEAKSPEGVQ
jgi:hypothetical protein